MGAGWSVHDFLPDIRKKLHRMQQKEYIMKNKFGIKEVVATGIGTALFIVLTNVQIPLGFIPNTSLQPRAALLAFFA